MNLRSTTPAQVSRIILRGIIILLAFAVLLVFSVSGAHAESQDPQKRIDSLTKQIDELNESTKSTEIKSQTVKKQLESLQAERAKLEQDIARTSSDLESLTRDVAIVSNKLEAKRSALGIIMANQYVDGSISPLEMLASSKSIADYFDRQTYQKSIQSELSRTMSEITTLKQQLSAKQTEVKRRLVEQQATASSVASSIKDQSELLVVTDGQGAHMTKMTAELAQEKKRLQTEQQQQIQSLMGGAEQVTHGTLAQITPTPVQAPVVATPPPAAPTPTPTVAQPSPSTPQPSAPVQQPAPAPVALPNGGYPSYLNNCYVDASALSYGIDPWGYGCRQCVSYTAWKVLQKTGRTAMYWGNANQWPASARARGYSTGSSPRAGSIGVMLSGPYGHVAWVESVNANGTINISQYNYWLPNKPNGGWGYYSEFRNVSPSTYQAYIYI